MTDIGPVDGDVYRVGFMLMAMRSLGVNRQVDASRSGEVEPHDVELLRLKP
ncbi:MAG TPA: hypothetical protein VNU71_09585 [Burkholderiaceae bacterium]|nr:hypothetical protein [Burkholderiaceae bacterium]